MQNTKKTGYIVSHTHWDREWRYPIWETRLMLIEFIDELIDLLETGRIQSFLMDGQVIPVLDYLDIRPDKVENIKKLIQQQKLLVGPWYTLPDEYPVHGEALVRNLLWGCMESSKLGEALKIGYTSFGWGQTAQLPQIYNGFGIDIAMVGKRVSKARAPQSEFLWTSPDGSVLLTTRFGEWGRSNFYFYTHLPSLYGKSHFTEEWQYQWDNGGVAFHRADTAQMEQDHFQLTPPDRWHPEVMTAETAEVLWAKTDESVIDNHRLMMNGCDYSAAQKFLPDMVERLNKVDTEPGRKWKQASICEFAEIMRTQIDRTTLPVVVGELRDGPAGNLTANALTTRLYLKQLNKNSENMLFKAAEPFAVMASLLGYSYDRELINRAWKYLLFSHPHDSINGVTQDKTADDVQYRLHQVMDISQTVYNKAMKDIVKHIDTGTFQERDVLLTVFNPLPYPREEVVEAWVNTPLRKPIERFWTHESEGVMLFDESGHAMDTQWMGKTEETYPVVELHTRAFPFYCDRHRLTFNTGRIPAGGYKVFRIGDQGDVTEDRVEYSGSKTRTGTILKSPDTMENEFLIVHVNANGTFDLTDKQSGRLLKNMNYFEDRGEHGTYWVNERPVFDQVFTTLGCSARIWAENSGPVRAAICTQVTLELPVVGDKQKNSRVYATSPMVITSRITLSKGQKHVTIETEFENRHKDHYLRAMFPSGITNAQYAHAGGHFIVDQRPIRPQGPDERTVWVDMATLPHSQFVDVSDGEYGVALINDCLTEYEVLDNSERTVALSLLRSVGNAICTEMRCGTEIPSQHGGQSLGHHKYAYAVFPHTGDYTQADVMYVAERFNVPVVPVQTRKNKGSLPLNCSLFEITNTKIQLSALKKAERNENIILRIYNPTSQSRSGAIKFRHKIETAWVTDMEEHRQEEIKVDAGRSQCTLTLPPYKIMTVEIAFETCRGIK